jgi:two-component system sensor histidine kinase ChvG
LKRSTAQDTGSSRDSDAGAGALLSLRWSGRISVTRRILAVNIFALLVLAASFFYLDSYRTRLLDRWQSESKTQVVLIAQALINTPDLATNSRAIAQFARISEARVRVIDENGATLADAWPVPGEGYGYDTPESRTWNMIAARMIDRVIDTIVFAPRLPDFSDRPPRLASTANGTELSYAPDRTPMISAFAALPHGYVLTTENARAITSTVRAERLRLALIILAVGILSVLLSLFLARTIVQPLRRLASAAVRVRLGRAREVTVPRFTARSDEIGMLGRAVSDMTAALRARIDATEAFAADVAHEIKNPLASLGSAVDSLAVVQQTELKAQLIDIIRGDVRRLDRLISDISGLSRLEAQMSRTPFTELDLTRLQAQCAADLNLRRPDGSAIVSVAKTFGRPPLVMGDATQLERVLTNLIENARSFAPADTVITIGSYRKGSDCQLWVEDEGPGVPTEARETIFKRFNSFRPDPHVFGQHSGLGLAIARTIIDAHHGSISVTDRADGASGARFVIDLPAAGTGQ